ncbi:L-threonylcarbamoyladenylate synthase [Hansschlegelia zhihuaiae]|uniref:Threonylcarbamoyl-AMP synthase n=1 Tax=Hansschlegelia zhihuaiae TaxID=405005 RepID=A0A4Q0ML67_9HYPH|nr:L-threonylcarbamoyladenylate synthase [Hansschlegelia zhihuaiae]RXF74420.1 threonylcarbamoyl-AMP synthase [Hansschlegelia zhihuaiae]
MTLRLGASDAAEGGRLLAEGKLVAFPTETVYGLGADACDPRAVAALYAAKGRPAFNPLISHVLSIEAAAALGRLDGDARRLAEAFWPGPLTLVVPAAEECAVCDLARAGLDTIALRAPDHPVARAVIAAANRPIVAPSANRSGRVSPTSAAHVLEDLDDRIDAVVDGGETRVGLESTIVACLGGAPRLLRPGALPRDAIERVLGRSLADPSDDSDAPLAPGRLSSHYAPAAAVRLDATEIGPGEAYLGFGPDGGLADRAAAFESLSPTGDLAAAAARLFACLRRLDATGVARIAVAPIPNEGLGEAIRDRLARAAAPRQS